MIRWMARALVLAGLGSAAMAQGAPQAAPSLRVDPLLIGEAREVWGLIASAKNPVWQGWNAADTPLLFYLPGEQDVLINHPHPPKGFVPYDGADQFPGWRIFVKNGPTLVEWDGQNTSKDVDGVQTLVVADTLSNLKMRVGGVVQDPRPAPEKLAGLRPATLAADPYDQLALVVHEAFHVFQDRQAPDKGANEMLLLYYPVLSVQNNVGFALEGAALAECLRASDPASQRRAAIRWLAYGATGAPRFPPKPWTTRTAWSSPKGWPNTRNTVYSRCWKAAGRGRQCPGRRALRAMGISAASGKTSPTRWSST